MNETLIFFKIVTWSLNARVSVTFAFVEARLAYMFKLMKLQNDISFNILMVNKYYSWKEFGVLESLRKSYVERGSTEYG